MDVKDFIKENGMQKKFFAQKLGVSRQTIYRMMTQGRASPQLVRKIREKFGVGIDVNIADKK